MLGVSNNPFSPFSHSSLVESAPRLAVARNQLNEIFDACDAAFGLDLSHSLFEQALPPSRTDDG
jgi:hypothetical protein